MRLTICRMGKMSYDLALKLQYELVAARLENRIDNTLLLLEHPPVLTMGTRADPANIYLPREQLAAAGVDIYEVNRGGDVTYHGPGQIVGYLIVQLKELDLSIRQFIQTIEESLIDVLQQFGIIADFRRDKYTGVWVGDRKIVAFGIAVQHGVTMHGFAFNVNTDLCHYDWINPCGLSMGVTSVANEIGHKVDIDMVYDLVEQRIAERFGWELRSIGLADLQAQAAGDHPKK